MTLTETRRPRPTPPTPVCEDCSRPITDPANTNRLRDAKGHFNGRARHHICPPVAVHVRQAPRWDRPDLSLADELASALRSPSPIPTRPVQKHFSEAGEKRSGIPWPVYVKIALIALVAGALAAVVIFMTGVA